MSGLDLLSTSQNSAAFSPGYAPTDLGQTIASSFGNIRQNYNVDAELRLIGDPLYQRNSLFKERTGKDIFQATGMDVKYPNPNVEGVIQRQREANALIDDIIARGRNENPTLYDGIKTSAEIEQEGMAVAQEAQREFEDVTLRNPSGTSRAAGAIVGGVGATLTDPVNLATLPIGAGEVKTIGTGGLAVARGIAITAAKEGAIQAAIEAASTPQIAHWQERLGHQYGLSEAATDVAYGFIGGAGIRAAAEGFVPALRGIRQGTAHMSSMMLDKLAESSILPQTVKDSLKYMGRAAYIDESAPIELRSMGELKAHRAAVEKVGTDIDNYSRPATDLPAVISDAIKAEAGDFVERRKYPETRQLQRDQQDIARSLYERAETVKPDFDSTARSISDDLGIELQLASIKGSARATEKIMADYSGDASRIKDLVRGTLVADRLEKVESAIGAINERFKVLPQGQRNLLTSDVSPADGYRDAKFNVDMGDGLIAEIQVNIPEMVKAKAQMHDLYKTRRNIEADMRRHGESKKGVAEVARLDAKMKEGYDAAWADFLKRSNSSSDISTPLRRTDAGSKSRGEDLSQADAYDNPLTDVGIVTGKPSTSQKRVLGEKSIGDKSSPDNNVTETQPESNEIFDLNAYRMREYRQDPITPPAEIKPSDRFTAAQTRFSELSKADPDLLIDLEDGSRVRLADYVDQIKQDQRVLEAITTCRLS